MADPRFFQNAGPFTLDALAERSGARLADAAEAARSVRDVAPLDRATGEELSFLDNARYAAQFAASGAGACIVRPAMAARAPAGMALLLSEQPYLAYARIAQAFYPPPPAVPGVAPTAYVDPSAELDASAEIGPGVAIGAGAAVGAGCRIGPNSTLGPGVTVGPGSVVHANVTLGHCRIGARVTLHPGVRIGQDGFGFAPHAQGHVKVPQLGIVVVEDDCDIGANTTIDRGSLQDTVIGRGCWIDNLVQIGHNVRLGRGCIIVAQVGIAGSTHLGDFVQVGGQAGLAGHLRVGSGVRIAGQSGVMNDVPPGTTLGGSPAVEHRQWLKETALLRRMVKRRDEKP